MLVQNKNIYKIIFGMLLIEYIAMFFSDVTWSGVHGDTFFSIQVDPIVWVYYLSGLPGIILTSGRLVFFLDTITIGLLIYMFINQSNRIVSILLFILLAILYFTLTGYLTHRNYQSGFFWVIFPFMFLGTARSLAFESLRYFLLFFYFSAGVYKLIDGALWNTLLFSDYLGGQFAPYFLEGNYGWRTHLNVFLFNHYYFAFLLYVFSFFFEIFTIVGFFTKRFDVLIFFLLISFHLFNWVLMDISAIGQLSFLCILFVRYDNSFSIKS